VTVETGVPLARFTTIGTGGPAAAFARPQSLRELEEAVRYASAEGLEVVVVGLGSNFLAADDGVDALVLRLRGELATVADRGSTIAAGGGATNAVILHRARRAGLGGFEFACAIPGTAGGGVRMNAGAYGRDFADVVTRALVCSADGSGWVARDDLALSYRSSGVKPGQVVAEVEFGLEPKDEREIKAIVTALIEQRKATQPTTKRTFGSVFKNPPHELGAGQMIERCGLKGYRMGGAVVSPKHANFIENAGSATSADCVALMVEARRRVHEEFGVTLEREVVLVGDLELPPLET
jgi:UDP-N-acetylmuramate dehydrogenase